MHKKALVTGASGFIGTHLCAALLARGDEVHCLVRPTSKIDNLKKLAVKFVEGDVSQPQRLTDAVDAVDVVYHLAGVIVAKCKADLMRINGQGTENLVQACARRANPPPVVYVSSMAAAGPAPGADPRRETDPASPISDYGRSKRAGERAVAEFAGEVPVTVIRPAIVFGPHDRLMLKMFEPIASTGIHLMAGFGSTRLALIHVDDLIDLILAAAESGERLSSPHESESAPGRGYYFASDDREYPSYRELGRMMAKAMQRGVVLFPVPKSLAWMAAWINQTAARLRGRPATFGLDKIREATVRSWACSSEKARRQLGFELSKPLAEHVRDTADWYLENGWIRIRFAPFKRRIDDA